MTPSKASAEEWEEWLKENTEPHPGSRWGYVAIEKLEERLASLPPSVPVAELRGCWTNFLHDANEATKVSEFREIIEDFGATLEALYKMHEGKP